MLRSLISLAGGLLLCATASAQVQNHVSPYKIGFDGWVLNPIVQTVGTNACVVHSFVALSKADSTYGENIVAVWYIREGNGTWSTKSWSTSDKGEAIKSVKVQMGLPDSEDALWDDGITTAVLAQKATSIPEDYQKGLLASDPYAQVLTDPFEREFVVEILADVGYRAASVLLDKTATTGCVDPLLTKLAGEVEKSNCSAGGAVSSAFFKMNVLGAGSMDILDPNYNILCCWVNQSFELIGPWGQQSPTCDYSFTPARCNWYLDGNLPVAGGWCVYRRLECMERVKSVLFVDADCVPHVTTYCQTKCFTATLQCGGYQGVGQCPATPPAGCTGATYTYWGGNPGWSLCFRP